MYFFAALVWVDGEGLSEGTNQNGGMRGELYAAGISIHASSCCPSTTEQATT